MYNMPQKWGRNGYRKMYNNRKQRNRGSRSKHVKKQKLVLLDKLVGVAEATFQSLAPLRTSKTMPSIPFCNRLVNDGPLSRRRLSRQGRVGDLQMRFHFRRQWSVCTAGWEGWGSPWLIWLYGMTEATSWRGTAALWYRVAGHQSDHFHSTGISIREEGWGGAAGGGGGGYNATWPLGLVARGQSNLMRLHWGGREKREK